MMQSSRSGERPSRRDRGATLLEAAVAIPVVLLLFFGMADASMALKTYSSSADAVRAGGRAASVAGADPMADAAILQRVEAESAGIGSGELDLVVVWHATGAGAQVPPACVPAHDDAPNNASIGVSDGGNDAIGACNVYVRPGMDGGAFDMAAGRLANPSSYYLGCEGATDPGASHKLDCNWPGKNRRAMGTARGASGTSHSPDFVGVYIRVQHRVLTSHLGSTLTITDRSIHLIEPEGYDLT